MLPEAGRALKSSVSQQFFWHFGCYNFVRYNIKHHRNKSSSSNRNQSNKASQQTSNPSTHKSTRHSPTHFPVASLAAVLVQMHRKLPAVLEHFSRSPVHLSALFLLHSSTSISHVTPSQPALQVHFPLTGSHDLVLFSTQLHLSVHSGPK